MLTFEQELGRRRECHHYASTRLWSPYSERVGQIGNWALPLFFGAPPDQQWKPGGDGGRDVGLLFKFWAWRDQSWYEADGKAARFPKWLPVNIKKCRVDHIYALVGPTWPLGDTYEPKGWEWGGAMAQQPITEKWCGNDADVYLKERPLLQRMSRLREAYRGMWRHYDVDGNPMEPRKALTDEELRPWYEELAKGIAELQRMEDEHERMAAVPQSGDYRDAPLPGG